MSADPIKAQSDIYITRSRTRAQLISKSPEIEMHGLRKIMYGILTPLGRIARLSQWQSMKFTLSQTLVLVTVRDQGQGDRPSQTSLSGWLFRAMFQEAMVTLCDADSENEKQSLKQEPVIANLHSCSGPVRK